MSEQPCTVAHDPQARGSTLTPNGTNGNGVPFSNRAFFSKPHVYVLHSSFEDTMGSFKNLTSSSFLEEIFS
jgi:hypothetical protein